MGRTVKRVPLDFDWPIDETWMGYLLPRDLVLRTCTDCCDGYTPDAAHLLAAAGHLCEVARVGALPDPFVVDVTPGYGRPKLPPGPGSADLVLGLAPDCGDRSRGFDRYRLAAALQKAAGLPDEWDLCPTCKGTAGVETYPGQAADADAWNPTEPPNGDGWQLWETTSEGSPVSPVFDTPEDLARWCVAGATVFGSRRASYEQWLDIVTGRDFAHVVVSPGVILM